MHTNGFSSHDVVDYDLHGIAGIRLVGATPDDAATVGRQLGVPQTRLNREADLSIRFVDRLPLTSPLRYLGVDDAGYTDDAFLVLRAKHKARTQVQIPLAQIGLQPCEIVCERGGPSVPLLIALVNLVALGKGILPMHASAFRYREQGVMVTGWSKGGKTETLLAFAAKGAEYIGDEWVYISADGKRIYGIPEPIRVWDWHLEELPECRARLGRGERARLRLLTLMLRSADKVASTEVRRTAAGKLIRRVSPLVQQQLHVDVTPQRLFNRRLGPLSSELHTVLFVVSHASPEVTVEWVDPEEIAERMVFSLQAERLELLSYYLKFRFGFPAARNELIEQAEDLQRRLLIQMLAGKKCYAIYHPYPVSIPALYEAITPYLEQRVADLKQ